MCVLEHVCTCHVAICECVCMGMKFNNKLLIIICSHDDTACPWVQAQMRPSMMQSMLPWIRELTLVSLLEMTMAVPATSHQPVPCIGKAVFLSVAVIQLAWLFTTRYFNSCQ